jgi:hypothetical protein
VDRSTRSVHDEFAGVVIEKRPRSRRHPRKRADPNQRPDGQAGKSAAAAEPSRSRRPARRSLGRSWIPSAPRHGRQRIRSVVVPRPRHHHRPRHNQRVSSLVPYGVYLAVIYAFICCLLLLGPWSSRGRLVVLGLVVGVALFSTAVIGKGLALPTWKEADASVAKAPVRTSASPRPFGALALQLTPLLVLAIVFPLVGARLHALTVGGTPVSQVILAGTVAVPVLAQIACAPLYRILGEDVYDNGSSALAPSFLSHWPSVFYRSVPLVVLLSVPFALTAHWSTGAVLAFALFMFCNLAMVQWFVVPIMARRYGLWAGAWLAYAGVLLLAPELCLIAPLAALFVLACRTLRGPILFPVRSTPNVWRTFATGSVLGTLLWLNPLLLLLVLGNNFRPTFVFLSLLPAIILFNAYFTIIAPGLQFSFDSLQHALHQTGVGRLRAEAEILRGQVRGKFMILGIAMVLATWLTVEIESLRPQFNTSLFNAMVICSVGFCLEAIFMHNLVQLKRERVAIGVSLVHCVLFAAAMVVWSPSAAFYGVNAAIEVVLVALLALVYSRDITEPHYAVFWGHAIAW